VHFGGDPVVFVQSLVACGWSHLTHLDDLPQKLKTAQNLGSYSIVELVSSFVFLPPDDAMTELRNLKYFTHICTWGKRDHKDRVSG
jgi:hypothetical protein